MISVLEPETDQGAPVRGGDREFGFVFAAVFALLGCWPVIHLQSPRWWALAVALAFGAVALMWPEKLQPLNRVWMAFGRLLHKVVSPVVMGVIFFTCVTPTAWIMRWRGKDLLSLKWDAERKSYWIERPAAAANANSMKNQF